MDAPANDNTRPNAVGIFHVNLNCTNLKASQAFYELIGFNTIKDFADIGDDRSFAEIGLSPILRVPPDCEAKAIFLALGDSPHATRLDLIFFDPLREGFLDTCRLAGSGPGGHQCQMICHLDSSSVGRVNALTKSLSLSA